MRTFSNIAEQNAYIGLPEPKNSSVDVGRYQDHDTLQQSPPIKIDFYRIAFKKNYINRLAPDFNAANPQPASGIFFYSPSHTLAWDLVQPVEGYYVNISRSAIDEHRYLFRNYLEYGNHEPLTLTHDEQQEVEGIFKSLLRHYQTTPENTKVLLSYVHVLVTLVEAFYERQFAREGERYNQIVTAFQERLHDYYNHNVEQLPNVQHFANALNLSANYLGDIVKHHTNTTALETIHKHIIDQAKERLQRSNTNISQVAYALGFEYPNNFSKFFKNHTAQTPSDFRKEQQAPSL